MIVDISVNDKSIQAALKKMLASSENTGPAMAGIAALMLARVEDNFRAEGRPQKWKPLKTSTLAARAAAGKSGKILQATGKLAASITPFHGTNYAGVGTNRPYAAAMNNGSRPHIIAVKNRKALKVGGKFFKRVKHPGTEARPFMVLTDEDKSDILGLIARHLSSGLQLGE